jgi:2-oxo-4-hydroxy-4-carboxy--5-ureidoimidazoline (OHCU) decarboxylase
MSPTVSEQPALDPLPGILSSPPSGADTPLARALSVLFEPSLTLTSVIVPKVASLLAESRHTLSTYADLVDVAIRSTLELPVAIQADFIAAHPRIGEVNGLSALSANEQAAFATPPEVLARLGHLNACYEHKFAGLTYITFVNGRSRADIAQEMEDALGIAHSLDPEQPPVESFEPVVVGDEMWKAELARAVVDVGRIAKSRLKALGVVA